MSGTENPVYGAHLIYRGNKRKDRNPEKVVVMVTAFPCLYLSCCLCFWVGFFVVTDTILTEDERLEFGNNR